MVAVHSSESDQTLPDPKGAVRTEDEPCEGQREDFEARVSKSEDKPSQPVDGSSQYEDAVALAVFGRGG